MDENRNRGAKKSLALLEFCSAKKSHLKMSDCNRRQSKRHKGGKDPRTISKSDDTVSEGEARDLPMSEQTPLRLKPSSTSSSEVFLGKVPLQEGFDEDINRMSVLVSEETNKRAKLLTSPAAAMLKRGKKRRITISPKPEPSTTSATSMLEEERERERASATIIQKYVRRMQVDTWGGISLAYLNEEFDNDWHRTVRREIEDLFHGDKGLFKPIVTHLDYRRSMTVTQKDIINGMETFARTLLSTEEIPEISSPSHLTPCWDSVFPKLDDDDDDYYLEYAWLAAKARKYAKAVLNGRGLYHLRDHLKIPERSLLDDDKGPVENYRHGYLPLSFINAMEDLYVYAATTFLGARYINSFTQLDCERLSLYGVDDKDVNDEGTDDVNFDSDASDSEVEVYEEDENAGDDEVPSLLSLASYQVVAGGITEEIQEIPEEVRERCIRAYEKNESHLDEEFETEAVVAEEEMRNAEMEREDGDDYWQQHFEREYEELQASVEKVNIAMLQLPSAARRLAPARWYVGKGK